MDNKKLSLKLSMVLRTYKYKGKSVSDLKGVPPERQGHKSVRKRFEWNADFYDACKRL